MKILILYASTEGQTRKIARFAADRLFEAGHSVEMLAAADAGDLDPRRFDAAILAGSVHTGRYQRDLADVASAQARALNALGNTLFLSVSLCAAGDDPDERADLDRITATFLADTGFAPDRMEQVAGAFRFAEYDFFKAWMMRRIAREKGETVDPHGDTEYTDWEALARCLADWAAPVAKPEETRQRERLQ